MKHLDSRDTRTLETLKALGQSKDTWALGHFRHSGTQALKALKALRHLVSQALGHSGTWAHEALEALSLADSYLYTTPK